MKKQNKEFEEFEIDTKKIDKILSYLQIENKYFKILCKSLWNFIYSYFIFLFLVLLFNVLVVGRDYTGNMQGEMQGEWLELALHLEAVLPILQLFLLIYFLIIGYKNRKKFIKQTNYFIKKILGGKK